MKKAAVVSQGGFTANYLGSSCLAAPPNAPREVLRADDHSQAAMMLPVKQTIAIGRQYGAFRFACVVRSNQHDCAKVNPSI
jgi:hypothetical protein